MLIHTENINTKRKIYSFSELFNRENVIIIVKVLLLNILMLFLGLMGDLNKISKVVSFIGGFVPFILMFYIIYENYVKNNIYESNIFYIFVFVWSLYGLSHLLNYNNKNTSYNILDLFSKNFWIIFTLFIT